MKKCGYCHNTGLLILRLLLAAVFIYHLVPKFAAPEAMVAFIWGVPTAMGLTFLSVKAWFWLAVVGESFIVLTMLLGLCVRSWAVVLWIIMLFAMTAKKWGMPAIELDAVLAILGIVLFVAGPGKFSLDKKCRGNDKCDK